MFMENLGNSILKKIPGCENSFVTPNGQIREGTGNTYNLAPFNPIAGPPTSPSDPLTTPPSASPNMFPGLHCSA